MVHDLERQLPSSNVTLLLRIHPQVKTPHISAWGSTNLFTNHYSLITVLVSR